nr:MAG TPA: hypothetical protein [Caudoviricetes sp.]
MLIKASKSILQLQVSDVAISLGPSVAVFLYFCTNKVKPPYCSCSSYSLLVYKKKPSCD